MNIKKNSCLSNPAAARSAGPVPAPVPVGELESGSQSGLQSCRPGPDPSMYMDPSLGCEFGMKFWLESGSKSILSLVHIVCVRLNANPREFRLESSPDPSPGLSLGPHSGPSLSRGRG